MNFLCKIFSNFVSKYFPTEGTIEDIAINVKMGLVQDNQDVQKIVAIAHENMVSIIGYSLGKEINFGKFSLPMNISHVFFVGYELIALSHSHIGVWRSQHWLTFRVAPITSFDDSGSFLFFGASNGSIYYIGEYLLYLWEFCVNSHLT